MKVASALVGLAREKALRMRKKVRMTAMTSVVISGQVEVAADPEMLCTTPSIAHNPQNCNVHEATM